MCYTVHEVNSMRYKLSQIPPPALAGVVKEKSVNGAIAQIKNCICDGATMIDLHVSCLELWDVETLKKILSHAQLPVLALNYNQAYDTQYAGFTEQARVESLLNAVRAGAAGIDMQGYTFHLPSKAAFCGEDRYSFTKKKPKEVVTDGEIIAKQCALIEQVHGMGAEVLLSCHPGISMTADEVVELALFLEARKPDIIKIVTRADSGEELAESIRAMLLLKKELRTPVAYHASGAAGMLSRIVNPLLGGHIAFCVDRYTENSTMEQIDLHAAAAVVENVKKIVGD